MQLWKMGENSEDMSVLLNPSRSWWGHRCPWRSASFRTRPLPRSVRSAANWRPALLSDLRGGRVAFFLQTSCSSIVSAVGVLTLSGINSVTCLGPGEPYILVCFCCCLFLNRHQERLPLAHCSKGRFHQAFPCSWPPTSATSAPSNADSSLSLWLCRLVSYPFRITELTC